MPYKNWNNWGTYDAVIQGLLVLAQDRRVDQWLRFGASKVLGRLGRIHDATRWLSELAQDKKGRDRVRFDASKASGQLGRTDDATRWLLVLAQDKKVYDWVRGDAAQELLVLTQDEKIKNGVKTRRYTNIGRVKGEKATFCTHGIEAGKQQTQWFV